MKATQRNYPRSLFADIKPRRLNHFYSFLCEMFPLEPISSKQHYEDALKMIAAGIRFSNENEGIAREREMVEQFDRYTLALATLIEHYEKEQFDEVENVAPGEILQFLMQQHGLRQVDLVKEIGTQAHVSQIINGKRSLTASQIAALSKRFGVSPAIFFPKLKGKK